MQTSPVVVASDPANCSFQFDPVGKKQFKSGCDLAKGALSRMGVSYSNETGTGPDAWVKIGNDLIKAGSAKIVVAGGMESMTNAPHMAAVRTGLRLGDGKLVDHMMWDGLTNPYDGKSMGVFAEQCADKYHFTRADQDAFATESVRRAQAAVKDGSFADEITAVTVPSRKGDVQVSVDETPGKVDPAKIPHLKPAFRKENGTVTAASSSSISDGGRAAVGGGRQGARHQTAGPHRGPCHAFAGTGMVHHGPGQRGQGRAPESRLASR